ncbi:MAG: hypothetical protein AB8H79_16640 [Myxococcota bacterium]
MAVINFARREIITRIVYFGAPKAGTTSNVRHLYEHGPWQTHGPLLPFGPGEEPCLFFEMLPDPATIPGFTLRVRVYALPGGQEDALHREEVLRDTDAIVLVADARPGRGEPNIDALLDLDRTLKDLELDLGTLPMVFQVNHIDHQDAEEVKAVVYDLNPYGHVTIPAKAVEGVGVIETLTTILEDIVVRLRDNLAGRPTNLPVHAIHRREPMTPEQVLDAHNQAINLARKKTIDFAVPDSPEVWSRSHYDILPTGLVVEVPYQPPDLVGMRPVHILDTRLENSRVQIDLVLDDSEGSHPTRLRVKLVPPGTASLDDPANARSGTVPAVRQREEVTQAIPDKIEIVQAPMVTYTSVWYGLLGVGAGIVVGLLLGFLIWA